MKKKVEKTIDVCDNCGADDMVFYHCLGCGKDFCYNCNDKRNVGKKYIHSVNFSGPDDGYFCVACLSLPTPKVSKILKAYLKIESLRNEQKAWYEDFSKREKEAELALKNIIFC